MKRIKLVSKQWMLMLLFLIGIFNAKATDVTVDGIIYTLSTTNATAAVTGFVEESISNDVVLPVEITYNDTKYSIDKIEQSAFEGCKKLESITIPYSVMKIGVCYVLHSQPASAKSVFTGCSNLKSVKFEDGTGKLELGSTYCTTSPYGTGMFVGCPLEEVYIGRDIEYLGTNGNPGNSTMLYGYSAFYGQKGLTKVTFGPQVTAMPNNLFYGCGIENIDFGEGRIAIAAGAFYNCTGLGNMVIPNNVTSIGHDAFYGSDLKSIVIGDKVQSIGLRAFNGCSELVSVEIGKSVTSIGESEFYDCTSLTSVKIGNSVEAINTDAFTNCSSLETITIPASVTAIGTVSETQTIYTDSRVFTGCTGLKSVIFEDGTTPVSLGSSYNDESGSNQIGTGLFADCPLEEVYLGRDIKYINLIGYNSYQASPERYGYSAFYNNSSLKKVVIGQDLSAIPKYLFYKCTGLTSVTIPPSVATISKFAFGNCSGVEELNIGYGLTTIDTEAFTGLANLNSLNITTLQCPEAPSDAFSSYGAVLSMVEEAAESFAAANPWTKFTNTSRLVKPESIETNSNAIKTLQPGETVQLTAKVLPAAALQQVCWTSSNPEVASVDNAGNLTLYSKNETCKITASTLYANAPTATLVINDKDAGVEEVISDNGEGTESVDYSQPYGVYNLQGVYVGDSVDKLAHGIYIVRQGVRVAKIAKM